MTMTKQGEGVFKEAFGELADEGYFKKLEEKFGRRNKSNAAATIATEKVKKR